MVPTGRPARGNWTARGRPALGPIRGEGTGRRQATPGVIEIEYASENFCPIWNLFLDSKSRRTAALAVEPKDRKLVLLSVCVGEN
jgi:hypothetical protein